MFLTRPSALGWGCSNRQDITVKVAVSSLSIISIPAYHPSREVHLNITKVAHSKFQKLEGGSGRFELRFTCFLSLIAKSPLPRQPRLKLPCTPQTRISTSKLHASLINMTCQELGRDTRPIELEDHGSVLDRTLKVSTSNRNSSCAARFIDRH